MDRHYCCSDTFSLFSLAPRGKEPTPLYTRPARLHRIASGLREVEERSPVTLPHPHISIARLIQKEWTNRLLRWRSACPSTFITNIPPGFSSRRKVLNPNRDDGRKIWTKRPDNF